MKYKNWDNFKVHVSGIGRIMSRPKGYNDLTQKDRKKQLSILSKEEKSPEEQEQIDFFIQKRERFINPPLSESAKGYLVDRYSAEKYNIRRASSGVRQKPTIIKGVALEKEGIDIISFVDNIKYKQPERPTENDYMIGECDILCYDNKKIVEVKTSWNASNFMINLRTNKLSFQQWSQIQGYLELYNMDYGQVCHVLVNTPPHLIDQEKINLFRRYTFGEINRDKYEIEVAKYDTLFDYSKIPIKKRIIRFDVYRCPEFIKRIESKVSKCREWLNGFERTFLANKNIVTLAEDYINGVPSTEENNTEYNPDEPHQGDQE